MGRRCLFNLLIYFLMKQSQLQQAATLRFRRMTRKRYAAFNTLHRVVTIGTLSSLALFCAYASTASAQNVVSNDPQTTEPEKEHELEQVTVTASKLATPLNQAAKLITVISAKDIACADTLPTRPTRLCSRRRRSTARRPRSASRHLDSWRLTRPNHDPTERH